MFQRLLFRVYFVGREPTVKRIDKKKEERGVGVRKMQLFDGANPGLSEPAGE